MLGCCVRIRIVQEFWVCVRVVVFGLFEHCVGCTGWVVRGNVYSIRISEWVLEVWVGKSG